MDKPVSLHHLIGARMRHLREARGLLQEEIAGLAREAGFDWVRGTVAMIESGRRRLTLEELLLLPQLLEAAGAGDLWLEDVLPADGTVLLSPLVAVPVAVLRSTLRGESRLGWPPKASGLGGVRDVPAIPGMAEARALWRRWWRGKPDPGTLYRVALASRGDAEIKVAHMLHVPPVAVALAAEGRWRRSLTEERDARVAEQSEGSTIAPRTVQARRGHITRQLVEELRPFVKGIPKKNITTKRRPRR